MFFENEIKKISERTNGRIAIFVDMDGVVADYRFGEGQNIVDNVEGTYLKKRAIKTTIKTLKKVNDMFDYDMFILSSCRFDSQVEEKRVWLEKHMPFIKPENQLFVLSDTFEDRKMLKINKIKQVLNRGYIKAIMVDDTHDILFLAINELKDKVVPFHVIALID